MTVSITSTAGMVLALKHLYEAIDTGFVTRASVHYVRSGIDGSAGEMRISAEYITDDACRLGEFGGEMLPEEGD